MGRVEETIMEKLITGIVNILPNILGKVLPEGTKTKAGGVGLILSGAGAIVVGVTGGESPISIEAGVTMILIGLTALGLYDKIDREG